MFRPLVGRVLTLLALRRPLVVRGRLSRCRTSGVATEVRRRAARRPRAVAVVLAATQATVAQALRQTLAMDQPELAVVVAVALVTTVPLAAGSGCMALALAELAVSRLEQPHAGGQVDDTAHGPRLTAARVLGQAEAGFMAAVAAVCAGPTLLQSHRAARSP